MLESRVKDAVEITSDLLVAYNSDCRNESFVKAI
jgi:hypothetical protein